MQRNHWSAQTKYTKLYVSGSIHILFFFILEPNQNIATVEANARVIEGTSKGRNALIDGVIKDFEQASGYTCHRIGSGGIVVQLAQPYVVGSMR